MVDEKEIVNIISSCIHAIKCPRGSFYPNKDYGSVVTAKLKGKMLLAAVRQAVGCIDGVYIKSVSSKDNQLTIDMLINDEEKRIELNI